MKKIILFLTILFLISLSNADYLSPSEKTSVSILVDNTPPIITIITPKNITYSNTTQLLINYTILDPSLDTAWYSLNNENNLTITSPFYLTLAEGDYILRISANDSANRVSHTEVLFSINNSAEYCGNSICSSSENCNLCSNDCGVCQSGSSPSSGSSGSSGGGSSSSASSIRNNDVNNTKEINENKTNDQLNENIKETKKEEKEILSNKINFRVFLTPIITIFLILIILYIYKLKKAKHHKNEQRRNRKI